MNINTLLSSRMIVRDKLMSRYSEASSRYSGPVELRQATSLDSFKSKLKTYLFKKYFDNL